MPEPAQASSSTREGVEAVVAALFKEVHHALPPPALELHSRLDADLGFDSLARAELLERLKRELKIEIPEEALESLDTIGDLVRFSNAAPKNRETDADEVHIAARELARPAVRVPSGEPTAATTLIDVLKWRVAKEPQAPHVIVLRDGNREALTYAALVSGARSVASGLKLLGLSPGATVALMLPTSVDYLRTFFGVLLAGGVPVPLYPPAHRTQLEEHVHRHAKILADAGAEVLITFREVRPVVHLFKSRVPSLRHIVSVADLDLGGQSEPGPGTVSSDSIAFLQYTSGSTGAPKGVVLTHANLLANIRAIGTSIRATEQDVFVSWLPLYHDMGLIGAWLGSLYHGCLLVLMSPTAFLARPARWLRAVHDFRATFTASPNFGYELVARRPTEEELQGLDLSSLRLSFNGAERVHPETLERFHARFARYGFRPQMMTPVYGLAEVGVGLAFPPLGRGPLVDRIDREQLTSCGVAQPVSASAPNALSFVSCGAALPGYRLRIIDEHGAPAGERVEGDLQFAGPSATSGYYRNVEATRSLLSGDWRNSGDRAYFAAGELFITGRSKDIVIRRGRHIYPEEIETAVGELAGIREGCVAAFGTGDPESGSEKLVVVAETRETDPLRRRELETVITTRVTAAVGEPADEIVLAAPHAVLKTSSGKLRRAATRQAYLEGSLGHAVRNPRLQMLRLLLENRQLAARRRINSVLRIAFGAYAGTLLLVIGTLALAFTLLVRSSVGIWRLNHRAARVFLRLVCMPVRVTGREHVNLRAPHILVVNHASYSDILFVTALVAVPHRFVAKAELERTPLLRRYLRTLRALFIERSAPQQSVAEVGRLREALRAGDALVMFPEGTFTREIGLRGFHLGAFQAAVAERVAIIPLALARTRSVLRDGQWLPRHVSVEATYGEPLLARADEEPFAAAIRLRDAARAFILQHCGEPDLTS